MSLFTHMFWFYFYSWFYILSEQIFSGTSVSMSSVTTHVLHNSFWKIRPLFGQILITCLKCSRASFLPSFYCRKMRWDPAWVLIPKAITVMLATMMIKILIILITIKLWLQLCSSNLSLLKHAFFKLLLNFFETHDPKSEILFLKGISKAILKQK